MSEGTVNGRADGKIGRMGNGQFAPGNRAGALGNLMNRKMQHLRATMLGAVTQDQVRAITATLADQAAKGDVASARTLFDYVLGKPVQAVELSGPDGAALGSDLVKVRAVILTALADDPEAKHKVARALLALGGGGAGSGPADDAGA